LDLYLSCCTPTGSAELRSVGVIVCLAVVAIRRTGTVEHDNRRIVCFAGYSRLMPAALTVVARRADSTFIKATNSSGVLPIGSAPSLASRSRTSPPSMASTVALRIVSTMFDGVRLGTTNPYHAPAS